MKLSILLVVLLVVLKTLVASEGPGINFSGNSFQVNVIPGKWMALATKTLTFPVPQQLPPPFSLASSSVQNA